MTNLEKINILNHIYKWLVDYEVPTDKDKVEACLLVDELIDMFSSPIQYSEDQVNTDIYQEIDEDVDDFEFDDYISEAA